HLRGKRAEPIDHRVDGALQLQDLALRGDGDLRGQVAVRDRGGDDGDVSNLIRQVGREHVDGVREVLPRAGEALGVGLGPEAPLAADLARDARDLRRERAQLFDRGVQRVLQLEDLTLRLDGDVLREVALRDGARDLRDVADLRGEVRGQPVDAVRQLLPNPRHPSAVRLASQLAFGPDLASDPDHLGREGAELIDGGVDGVFELEDFAARLDGDLLRQISVRDG